MIADRARLRVMLASGARTFHVGPLADCFFNHATALCVKRVTTPDPAQPLPALCEPTRGPNAPISAPHTPPGARPAAESRPPTPGPRTPPPPPPTHNHGKTLR